MRRLPLLAASVLLGVTATAQAQDQPAPATDSATAMQDGAVAGAPTLGSVISAISASGSVARDIENIPETSTVTVVEASQVPGGTDTASIETALAANEGDVEALRSALQGDGNVQAALQAQGVLPAEIIAADVDATGNVTVYTHRGG